MSDRFSTGSSLMPQKRNPDAMELARGKAGRLIGGLTGVLATLKGLPSGYNKDLQEDKEALFAAFDTLESLLPAVAGSVRSMEIDAGRCRDSVDAAMLATDVADFLVRRGVPFREAHGIVGRLVRAAEELGCGLDELDERFFTHLHPAFEGADFHALFSAEQALASRAGIGGNAPDAVVEQILELRSML
jgi:argininosuccinate lyase